MRATSTLILLVAVISVAPAVAADPSFTSGAKPWGIFSIVAAAGQETTEVEIYSVVIINTAEARPETNWINEKSERVWVAKRQRVKAGAPAMVQWTDSRGCYQLIETLAMLVDLDHPSEAPSVSVDDRSGAGVIYHLQAKGLPLAPGRPGAIRLTNGKDVPVSVLVRSAFDAWRPCWSDGPPTLSERP